MIFELFLGDVGDVRRIISKFLHEIARKIKRERTVGRSPFRSDSASLPNRSFAASGRMNRDHIPRAFRVLFRLEGTMDLEVSETESARFQLAKKAQMW